MNDRPSDKRRFTRIPFTLNARLKYNQTETDVQLLDLSLKGALIDKPSNWNVALHDSCVLLLHLDESITIEMATTVAHITGNQLGLKCDYIDVDSITQLRRLISLNSGDSDMLDRELIELTAHEPL